MEHFRCSLTAYHYMHGCKRNPLSFQSVVIASHNVAKSTGEKKKDARLATA